MQNTLLITVAALMLFATGCCSHHVKAETVQRPLGLAPEGWVRHVVLFKFKDSATPEQVKKIEDAFAALPKQIPQIQAFEWGTNVSPENLNEGLTHAFFVTFASEADRDKYIHSAPHQAFVELLKPSLEKAVVVDYLAKY